MSERASALKPDEAIKIFEFFYGNGSRDKEQTITLTSWLLLFAFGLIAYCWKAIIPTWRTTAAADPIAIVAGVVAILLSGYAIYIVREFVIHAEENFRRANKAIEKTENTTIKCLLAIKKKEENWWLLQRTRNNFPSVSRCDDRGAHYVGRVFLVLLWSVRLTCAVAVVSLGLAAWTVFHQNGAISPPVPL